MQHQIRAREQPHCAHRQQFRIARARADQIHGTPNGAGLLRYARLAPNPFLQSTDSSGASRSQPLTRLSIHRRLVNVACALNRRRRRKSPLPRVLPCPHPRGRHSHRSANLTPRQLVQQRLARLPDRLHSHHLPPQPPQFHQPLTHIQGQGRINLLPQPAAPAPDSPPPWKSQSAAHHAAQSMGSKNHKTADHPLHCTAPPRSVASANTARFTSAWPSPRWPKTPRPDRPHDYSRASHSISPASAHARTRAAPPVQSPAPAPPLQQTLNLSLGNRPRPHHHARPGSQLQKHRKQAHSLRRLVSHLLLLPREILWMKIQSRKNPRILAYISMFGAACRPGPGSRSTGATTAPAIRFRNSSSPVRLKYPRKFSPSNRCCRYPQQQSLDRLRTVLRRRTVPNRPPGARMLAHRPTHTEIERVTSTPFFLSFLPSSPISAIQCCPQLFVQPVTCSLIC